MTTLLWSPDVQRAGKGNGSCAAVEISSDTALLVLVSVNVACAPTLPPSLPLHAPLWMTEFYTWMNLLLMDLGFVYEGSF